MRTSQRQEDLGTVLIYAIYSGFIHLAAGLCCGLTGLAAGHAIGLIGDAVRDSSAHTFGL